MKYAKQITIASVLLTIGALVESLSGILSSQGQGSFLYTSIRGETIEIYGMGVYRHMTSEVAVQGIAQDYVTLFVAIPLLHVSLYVAKTQSVKKKMSVKAQLILSGTLLYFTLTYLFHIAIAMYNEVFLVAVFSLACALFAFVTSLVSFDYTRVIHYYKTEKYLKASSYYLIVMVCLMSLLWLSIIVPPLLSGELYPKGIAHYTTMIVQGFDLGIFLPFALVSAILALRKHEFGYVFVPTYLVFLAVLMTALVMKVMFMARYGANVVPVIYIIPVMWVSAVFFAYLTLGSLSSSSLYLSRPLSKET